MLKTIIGAGTDKSATPPAQQPAQGTLTPVPHPGLAASPGSPATASPGPSTPRSFSVSLNEEGECLVDTGIGGVLVRNLRVIEGSQGCFALVAAFRFLKKPEEPAVTLPAPVAPTEPPPAPAS